VKDSFYKKLDCVFNKFLKYHTNILLGDFNAKVGKDTFSNQQLGMKVYIKLVMIMDLPHLKISQSKVRCCHVTTSINILGDLQMGKPTIRSNYLIDGRRHSSVLDVCSFRATDHETDHYLVVAKASRERLVVGKQRLLTDFLRRGLISRS
jgi:hypothetical protein